MAATRAGGMIAGPAPMFKPRHSACARAPVHGVELAYCAPAAPH